MLAAMLGGRLLLVWLVSVALCTLHGQERFDDSGIVSIRVQLGVGDSQPISWNGQLAVSGGELTGLASLRPRPDDTIEGASWRLSSWQGPGFWYPAPKPQPVTGRPVNIFNPGLIVDIRSRGRARVSFETDQGDFRVDLRALPAGSSQRFLGGRVVVDRTVTAQKVSMPEHQNDFASVASGPGGQLWVVWVAFRDWANDVQLRHYDGRSWGEIQTVTERPGDVFLAKVARGGDGWIRVVWSDQVNGNRDLYARSLEGGNWSSVERLSTAAQPDLYHNVVTASDGSVWVAWQGFRDGQSGIFARRHGGGEWSPEQRVSSSDANDWEPAVAADGRGNVYVAWDTYDKGNYDILTRRHDGDGWQPINPLADTPKFEAHVTIDCDAEDRLWAAWSESGTLWGKDDGFGLEHEGTRLYEWRTMAIAVLDGGKWHEPIAALDAALPSGFPGDRNDSPTIRADGNGGIWVFFRRRNPRMKDIISDMYNGYAAHDVLSTLCALGFLSASRVAAGPYAGAVGSSPRIRLCGGTAAQFPEQLVPFVGVPHDRREAVATGPVPRRVVAFRGGDGGVAQQSADVLHGHAREKQFDGERVAQPVRVETLDPRLLGDLLQPLPPITAYGLGERGAGPEAVPLARDSDVVQRVDHWGGKRADHQLAALGAPEHQPFAVEGPSREGGGIADRKPGVTHQQEKRPLPVLAA